MDIRKRQPRRTIGKSLRINDGTIYVTRTPYGDLYGDDKGNNISIGAMVKMLIDARSNDRFQTPQSVDQRNLGKLLSQHEKGVQGGMERWDGDVFRNYYNVDLERVVKLYARRMNLSVAEVNDNHDKRKVTCVVSQFQGKK